VPMLWFIAVGSLVGLMMQGQDSAGVLAALSGIVAVVLYYVWIWQQGAPEGFVACIVEVKNSET